MMRVGTFLILGYLTTTILACSTPQPLPDSTRVPITSLRQILGKWEGVSKRLPDMRDHAQVMLIISDNGHFNFVSDRGTDLLLGTGAITLADGKAYGENSSGRGTLTLHQKAGETVLVVEAA